MYVDVMMSYIWDACVSEMDHAAEGMAHRLNQYVAQGGKMPRGMSRQQVHDWLTGLDLI